MDESPARRSARGADVARSEEALIIMRARTKAIAGFASVTIVLAAMFLYFDLPSVMSYLIVTSERWGAGLEEKTIRAGDYEYHYLTGGPENDTPVFMLHGFAAFKDTWVRFVDELDGRQRIYAVDLPGFGETKRVPGDHHDIGAQVGRLSELVEELKLKRFHLVGSSVGGYLAAAYTAQNPDQVASLTLIGIGGITSPNKSILTRNFERDENPLLGDPKWPLDPESLLKYSYAKEPPIPSAIRAEFIKTFNQSNEFFVDFISDLQAKPVPLEPLLGKIAQPVLIIWGDTDRVVDISAVEVLRERLPQASVVIMKDCGHTPHIERPGETARHYLEFLGKIGEN